MGIFFRPGLFPPTTGAAEPWRPWRSLSGDVTGAPVLCISLLCLHSFCFVCTPLIPFNVSKYNTPLCTKVKRTTVRTNMVCAALCPFGGLVVLLICCPVRLLGSFCLWCSCWSVLLSSWFCCAPLCAWVGPAAPVLFFAFCLAPLSAFFCFPSPRGLSCLVPCSSSYLGVLVRPSGYLVAAVTA